MNEIIHSVSMLLLSAAGFYAVVFLAPKIAPKIIEYLDSAALPGWLRLVVEMAKPLVHDEWENIAKDVKKSYEDGIITKEEWKQVAEASKKRVVEKLLAAIDVAHLPESWKPFLKGRAGEIVEQALAEVRNAAGKKLLGAGKLTLRLPVSPSNPVDTANDLNPDPTTDLDNTPASE